MEKLMNWLASGKDTVFCDQGYGDEYSHNYNYVFVRTRMDKEFDLLFCQKIWRGENPRNTIQPEPLSYAGMYFKPDGRVYDAQDFLIEYASNPAALRESSRKNLMERIQQEVREKVESIIGNDRSKLQVVELTNVHLRSNLRVVREFGAKSAARLRYLEEAPQPIQFHCNYEVTTSRGNLRDSNLLMNEAMFAYLRDPDAYVEQEANRYIKENQEEMLCSFLSNDLLQEEYDKLVADTSNQIHVVKKIVSAMRKEPLAKTVNVTIQKDGKTLSFKTNTDQFRGDCPYHYNKRSIISQDQRRFESSFGNNASYGPKDIVRITYGRKVLYEKNIGMVRSTVPAYDI